MPDLGHEPRVRGDGRPRAAPRAARGSSRGRAPSVWLRSRSRTSRAPRLGHRGRRVQGDDPAAQQPPAYLPRTRHARTARPARAGRGSAARSPAGTRRRAPPGSSLPSGGTSRSNQSRKNGREPAPAGCVISRQPRRPPGRSTRRSSREPRLEVGDVAHAEADRRGVERLVREREREHVAAYPLDRGRLAHGRALEHPLREVETGHPRRRRERQASARSPVPQHASRTRSPGPHDRRSAASSRQRRSSPAVMTRFMRS